MRRGRIRSAINLFLKRNAELPYSVILLVELLRAKNTQDDNNKWWFIISNSLINHLHLAQDNHR